MVPLTDVCDKNLMKRLSVLQMEQIRAHFRKENKTHVTTELIFCVGFVVSSCTLVMAICFCHFIAHFYKRNNLQTIFNK